MMCSPWMGASVKTSCIYSCDSVAVMTSCLIGWALGESNWIDSEMLNNLFFFTLLIKLCWWSGRGGSRLRVFQTSLSIATFPSSSWGISRCSQVSPLSWMWWGNLQREAPAEGCTNQLRWLRAQAPSGCAERSCKTFGCIFGYNILK